MYEKVRKDVQKCTQNADSDSKNAKIATFLNWYLICKSKYA
jgi:hypothetical protein